MEYWELKLECFSHISQNQLLEFSHKLLSIHLFKISDVLSHLLEGILLHTLFIFTSSSHDQKGCAPKY